MLSEKISSAKEGTQWRILQFAVQTPPRRASKRTYRSPQICVTFTLRADSQRDTVSYKRLKGLTTPHTNHTLHLQDIQARVILSLNLLEVLVSTTLTVSRNGRSRFQCTQEAKDIAWGWGWRRIDVNAKEGEDDVSSCLVLYSIFYSIFYSRLWSFVQSCNTSQIDSRFLA